MPLKSWVREPLLHFLVIGAMLFAGYALLGGASRVDKPRIVVSGAHLDQLASAYAKAWRRAPTDDELKGLLDDWLTEEIVVREAVAAGLDRDDPIIRRRLRQKFDVIAEEQGNAGIPADAELEAYLAAHPERFALAPVLSFQQIVLAGRTAADAERAAVLARPLLARGADPGGLAVPSMLPARADGWRLEQVARDFGKEFADALAAAPLGAWEGPVRSSYGWHLVHVTAHAPAALPPLAAVRGAVAREWESDRRTVARNDEYRRLRDRYDIVVEARPVTAAALR